MHVLYEYKFKYQYATVHDVYEHMHIFMAKLPEVELLGLTVSVFCYFDRYC